MRYSRNTLYIQAEQQHIIAQKKILIGGCGLGSNIAECLLRLGFEHLRLVDGDVVELSNLNRQNYTLQDVGQAKALALQMRLSSIHPQAHIEALDRFITEDNLSSCLEGVDLAINALDFSSSLPFLFDQLCIERGIAVVHPYNLGWAAMAVVIKPGGMLLDELIGNNPHGAELRFVHYMLDKYLPDSDFAWLKTVARQYMRQQDIMPPPQLAVGSWAAAALTARLLYRLAIQADAVQSLPRAYWLNTGNIGGV